MCSIHSSFRSLLSGNTCILAEPTLLEKTCHSKLSDYGVACRLQLIICVNPVWREFHVVDLLDVIVDAGFILC